MNKTDYNNNQMMNQKVISVFESNKENINGNNFINNHNNNNKQVIPELQSNFPTEANSNENIHKSGTIQSNDENSSKKPIKPTIVIEKKDKLNKEELVKQDYKDKDVETKVSKTNKYTKESAPVTSIDYKRREFLDKAKKLSKSLSEYGQAYRDNLPSLFEKLKIFCSNNINKIKALDKFKCNYKCFKMLVPKLILSLEEEFFDDISLEYNKDHSLINLELFFLNILKSENPFFDNLTSSQNPKIAQILFHIYGIISMK